MQGRRYTDSELKRLQGIELEMLLAVDEICKKHDITYFVDGGTCLGAVRHGGFIPWDDDIDVGMPLDDYHRFISVAKTELPEGMSLHSMEDTEGYYVQWVKIFKDRTLLLENDAVQTNCKQGIFIDVFPYVGVSDNGDGGNGHLRKAQFWNKLTYIYFIRRPNVLTRHSMRPVLQAAWSVIRFFLRRLSSPEKLRKRFWKACGTESTGAIMGNPTAARPIPFLEEDLLPPRTIIFEGHEVMGPNSPEAFLTKVYGPTYMTLPPEDQRITHAPFVLEFGDEPDKERTTESDND